MQDKDNSSQNQQIEVAIVTTSGAWPTDGFDRVPSHQKIKIQLQEATRKLKITDTTSWIAIADGKELNIETSYIDNGLLGQITIDYGPREGGGGNE